MKYRDLTILQYHNVSDADAHHRMWISPASFKKQIHHLQSGGFAFLPMDRAIDYMKFKLEPDQQPPISLTFDNGFEEFFTEVLPVLEPLHITATLLMSPRRIGKTAGSGIHFSRYLNLPQLREIVGLGHQIGVYEDDAMDINAVPPDRIKKHIITYKKVMEELLGVNIDYFGAKEGIPPKPMRELMARQGYKAYLCQCPTFTRPDPYAIGRIQIDDNDFNIFLTKISKSYLFFKDKKAWPFMRRYRLDRLAHTISETMDKVRGS